MLGCTQVRNPWRQQSPARADGETGDDGFKELKRTSIAPRASITGVDKDLRRGSAAAAAASSTTEQKQEEATPTGKDVELKRGSIISRKSITGGDDDNLEQKRRSIVSLSLIHI